MTTYTIDLSQVHSHYELHDHLAQVFSLPDYYGQNMDALWDCLHCWFDEPTMIEVRGIGSIPHDLQDTTQRLQTVLKLLQEQDGILISYLETA